MFSLRRRLPTLIASTAAVLALGVGPAQADVLGVDTSHWQHPANQAINWKLLPAQGYQWAVMKAVEGTTYIDPSFAQDWAAAGNAGLIRGAYDFAAPTNHPADAVVEARHLVAVSGPLRARNTLPPVLDLEVSNGLTPAQLVAWTRAWIDTAQALTGRRPIIYTGLSFWQTAMGNSKAFTGYPLWLAAYRSTPPPAPGGWPNFTMWQYSSTGRVTGIPASVDLDRFAGSPAALALLANGTSTISVNPFGSVTLTRTPAGVSVDGWAIDPDTAAPVQVTVAGMGTSTTVAASAPSSYVGSTWPWYGTAHGFHVVLPAVQGHQTITVTAANVGAGADTALPTTPIDVGLAPTGSATLTQTPDGLRAQGWALDPDTTQPLTVHMTVDGTSVSTASAGLSSTAAAAAWPGYGSGHGIDTTVPIPTGTHTMCLTADNLGLGSGSPALACTDVTKYDHPTGAVAPYTAVPGGVAVTGWALDDSSSAATTIVATVDGTPVQQGLANLVSTQVPPPYAAFGANHGLAITVAVPAGSHDVCIVAQPVASTGTTGQLGCSTVTRSSDPVGVLSTLSLRTARVAVTGWVLDPDTATPVTARMTVDGRTYASATASRRSSPAAVAHPAWGSAHGYALTAYVPAGRHTVCVVGVGAGPGASASLGCRVVTVAPDPFGSVAVRRSGATVSVTGWAADPSTARAIWVRVSIDGRSTRVSARSLVGSPDLGRLGSRHGFALTRRLAHGRHTIAVYAVNVGAGHDVLIRTVIVRT
jgi:GH25 family lysozyme M1 (1,4-beta-N-acetylmuramidase)